MLNKQKLYKFKSGEYTLPVDIKKAAIALIISCFSSLIAVYFDGLEFEEIGYSDPFILAMNFIWVGVIAWIIWDLLRGKDIKWTLILVGAIMLASLIWDYLEFGIGTAQIFYLIELLMFVVAYMLIKSESSKSWYAAKKL